MGPRGAEGILLMRIEAFPFMRSRERREKAWLQTIRLFWGKCHLIEN